MFATLLKEDPLGCEDARLPEPIKKNHSISNLRRDCKKLYNGGLCVFFISRSAKFTDLIYLKKKVQNNCLFSFWTKTGEQMQQIRSACVNCKATVENLFQQNIFLYDFDVVDEAMIGKDRAEELPNIPNLYDKYATIASFETSLTTKLFSKIMAASLVKLRSAERHPGNIIQSPAVKHLRMSIPITCVGCVRHWLEKWLSWYLFRAFPWPFSILIQSVWKMTMENIRRQEQGLENMTKFCHRFHPIIQFNKSSSMLHFLAAWYHRSLTFWRIWKPKSKAQNRGNSLQIVTERQKKEILNSSWKHLINAPVTVFETKQKCWQIFPEKVQQLSQFRRTQITENFLRDVVFPNQSWESTVEGTILASYWAAY